MQNKFIYVGLMAAIFGIMWFLTWAFSVRFDDDEYKQIFWFFISLLGLGTGSYLIQKK